MIYLLHSTETTAYLGPDMRNFLGQHQDQQDDSVNPPTPQH